MGVCLKKVKGKKVSGKSKDSKRSDFGNVSTKNLKNSGESKDSGRFDFGNILNVTKKVVVENKEIIVLLFLLGCVLFSNLGAYKMFMWDESQYASIARCVYTGEGYSENGHSETGRLPVYPLSIAAAFAFFGVSYETTKIPGIMFALLSVFAVYFFAGKYAGKKAGLASAFLIAVTPLFFTLSLNTLTEMTFSTLFFLSAIFFYLAVHENGKYFYLSAVFFGLSFLTRYNAALFPIVAAVYMAYLFFRDKEKVYAVLKSKHAYFSLVLFLVVMAPWMFYMHAETGDVFSGLRGAQTLFANYELASFPWYHYFVLIQDVLGMPVLLLFILGIGYSVYKKNDFGIYCLIFILVNLAYFSRIGWKEERMMVSWLPFMLILSGIGLMNVVYPWLRRDLKSEFLSVAVCVLLVFGVAYFNYTGDISPTLEYSTAIGYPSLIQAASFVEAESGPDESIVGASVPQYFWYSKRIVRWYPSNVSGLVDMLSGDDDIRFVLIGNYERIQPEYVVPAFSQAFFDEQGQLKYAEDAQKIKIFGDIAHFNDPMRYPVTIVVPSGLFVERLSE